MSAVIPESFNKRSFVYRKLSQASFGRVDDSCVAMAFSNDHLQAARAGLLDLSTLTRLGYRGTNASTYLQGAGYPVPEVANQAVVSDDGDLILRLSQNEFWILSAFENRGTEIAQLRQRKLPDNACYPLFCQESHAWFVMTGVHLAAIMAKICGIDLRDNVFPIGSIAQTSVARVNVVLVHHQVNDNPCFSILCDSAAAEYLWDCLLDAMDEYGGEVIGLNALV